MKKMKDSGSTPNKGLSTIILVGLMVMLLNVTFGCASASSKNENSDSSGLLPKDSVVGDSAEGEENQKEEEIGKDAVRDLFGIYGMEDLEGGYSASEKYYTRHFKEQYRELGATRRSGEPYTKSFVALLEKISKAENEGAGLIIDCDILLEAQETPTEMDLEIKNVKVESDDKVIIDAVYSHKGYENPREKWNRRHIMIREKDGFKIDDMLDFNGSNGTRKRLDEALANAKKYIKESKQADEASSTEVYTGTIGPYAIEMKLKMVREEYGGPLGAISYYKGSYTYKEAGNTLSLEGYLNGGNLYLDEYTSKGKNSGRFQLEDNGDEYEGTFTNLTNGKEFKVKLRRQ